MKVEIEAKLKIDLPKTVLKRLQQIGAEHKYDVKERDSYFADAGHVIVKKGCGLRLRLLKTGEDEKYILTFKGPRQKGRYKKRDEVEVCVEEPQAMEDMLRAFGCRKKLKFEKRRSIWSFGGCSVSVDRLPLLGDFIEVEGPDEETITQVLRQLGLSELKHISKGYARLMADKLDEMGTGNQEVFFED